jgi:hypothetical protein
MLPRFALIDNSHCGINTFDAFLCALSSFSRISHRTRDKIEEILFVSMSWIPWLYVTIGKIAVIYYSKT